MGPLSVVWAVTEQVLPFSNIPSSLGQRDVQAPRLALLATPVPTMLTLCCGV